MNTRVVALLIPTAVACAGGSTLRVAEGDDSSNQPVALAPTPEPVSDSGGGAAPPPTADTSVGVPSQGYAAYGASSELELRRIGQWARTGIGEARRMVIRDANGFDEAWSELGAGDRPEVDFTHNVVVLAALGERPTGGYEIAVSRVAQADGQLSIEVVETTPGPNCITAGPETQPVDMVIVPAAAVRGWSFLERNEIRACR
jgi:PrcB C-terminal